MRRDNRQHAEPTDPVAYVDQPEPCEEAVVGGRAVGRLGHLDGPIGLARRQWDILTALTAGECGSGEVARRANINQSHAAYILPSLCWKGLVERFRGDHDSRRVYYRLTEAGRAALQGSAKAA